MDKILLEKCIQKYNLGGAIESVIWTSDGDSMTVRGASEDMQVISFVDTDRIKLPENDYPIYDTSQLKGLLSVLEGTIECDVISNHDDVPVSIVINDRPSKGTSEVRFVLSNKSIIPEAPTEPPTLDFDMKVTLSPDFTMKFIKASGALQGAETFTVVEKNDVTNFIVGYSDRNTTRISLEVESEGTLDAPLTFSSKHLREILLANKETNGIINVSNKGLMNVTFEKMVFDTRYYLPKMIVND